MLYLIGTITKYVMLLCMVLYTIISFRALLYHRIFPERVPTDSLEERRRKMEDSDDLAEERWERSYVCQMGLAIICFLAGSVNLFLNHLTAGIILRSGVMLLFLTAYPMIMQLIYPRLKTLLLCDFVMYSGIGYVILSRLSPEKYAPKQVLMLIVIGAALMWIPKIIEKLKDAKIPAAILGILGLISLIGVIFLGSKVYGANLSISLKGFSIQPSEVVKITFVMLIAMLFRNRSDFKRVFFATGVAAVHVLVLVLSKDLGAALIFFVTYLVMLYQATIHVKKGRLYPLAGLGCGAVGAVGAFLLFDHVRQRVTVWLDPWPKINDTGYQITQSLFAIGNGSLLGTGLYRGRPTDIPLVSKDFIFAAIAEEFGGIFSIFLILAILATILRMIRISATLQTVFYRLVGLGFATVYAIQVFLTVGGDINMIPLTGVTLPWISYGGSSLLCMYLIFMILYGLVIMRENEEIKIGEEYVSGGRLEGLRTKTDRPEQKKNKTGNGQGVQSGSGSRRS